MNLPERFRVNRQPETHLREVRVVRVPDESVAYELDGRETIPDIPLKEKIVYKLPNIR